MTKSARAMTVSGVYIVDGIRTPIGRLRGSLSSVRPDDLAAQTLRSLVKRTECSPHVVDEVIMGCANQAGEDNRNIARMALLLAGIPTSVPGITVNRLCASGLSAVNFGARQIAVGEADLVIAGGVESMSRAPLVMAREGGIGHRTAFDTTLGWRFPNPKMETLFPLESMGETAENLVEELGLTREAQDVYALQSHQRTIAAEEAGRFEAERIPITITRKNSAALVHIDESPRRDTSPEQLAKLQPVFRPDGTVTAGNASSLNDGASCLLLASEKGLRKIAKKPMARWIASSSVGVEPRLMGIGPVPAVKKILSRTNLKTHDIDVYEINEAFAAQTLAVVRQLNLMERLADINPNGGAIALGHPLGMSGARLLTTLIHELNHRKVQRGIATLCVGVGQGVATLVERVI